jgi:hypothetical protein
MVGFDSSFLKALIPIIIGGLIAFSATTIYNDFWKQPEILVKYKRIVVSEPFRIKYNDELNFINVGRSTADNIRITIAPSRNVVNFTKLFYSQNINLTLDEETRLWIIQDGKFPVGAKIQVRPKLNLSSPDENAEYFINTDYDQGHGEVKFNVTAKNNRPIVQTINVIPRVDIALPTLGFIAASLVGIIYYLFWRAQKRSQRERTEYLQKLNDELHHYYTSQKKDKEECLNNLNNIRNEIKNKIKHKRIKRSDYEILENKLLEYVGKMNED